MTSSTDRDYKPVCPVDHHSSDYAHSALELHSQLREECPVAWSEAHGGFWAVSSYQEARTVLHDAGTYSSGKTHEADGTWTGGSTIPTTQRPPLLPLEMDAPLGTAYRRLITPWLSRAAVNARRDEIAGYVDDLLDRIDPDGRFDIIADLGEPLPAIVVTSILGIDRSYAERISWPFHAYESVPRDSDEFAKVLSEMAWLRQMLTETCEERRLQPGQDAISELVTAEVNGELLPIEHCVGLLLTIIGGGVDTTTSALGHCLHYLDQHRQDRERLIADPNLLPVACEEFLRVFPPVWQLSRRVASPSTLDRVDVEPGQRVLVSVLSSNRDPEIFEDPDEVVIDRAPNPHVTFGLGAHRCAGLAVARLELELMIGGVLKRFPNYRVLIDEAKRYAASGDVAGWITMPAIATSSPD